MVIDHLDGEPLKLCCKMKMIQVGEAVVWCFDAGDIVQAREYLKWMEVVLTREMKSDSEMMYQGGMYHFKHQVSPIPRSFNKLPDASNRRNRLSISSPAIELRREWEEPMTFVTADPRLALGGRQ